MTTTDFSITKKTRFEWKAYRENKCNFLLEGLPPGYAPIDPASITPNKTEHLLSCIQALYAKKVKVVPKVPDSPALPGDNGNDISCLVSPSDKSSSPEFPLSRRSILSLMSSSPPASLSEMSTDKKGRKDAELPKTPTKITLKLKSLKMM
jgi:hypothetical protein